MNLPRTFIRDLDLIEEFKDYDEELKELYDMRKNRGYDFGEYLSQGALKIEGRCAMVPAQDLVDNGLLDIRPDLPAGSDQDWTHSVLRLRQKFSGPHTTRFQYTSAQKEAINKIADLFESEFWLPMALALMTVLPCRLQGFGLDGIIEDDKLRHMSITRHRILTARNPEDYDPMHDAVVQLSVSDTRSFSSLEPEQLKYIKWFASLPEVQQFEWLAYNYSGYLNLLLTRGSLIEAEDELKQSRAFSAWLWERGDPVVLPSFHKLRQETKALAFSARTMSNNLWKEL
ncbi:hypothetical protein B9Z65_5963 [Elsinoe australis]|uniref:Uncharacterized protein n=1 Tax=Elsinoe australis TaxID=40998 RepID=A0A2P7YJI7_9PEZI|nr:hypothetical protein B9Z65_5963 [Elsinoe australis]